MTMRSLIAVSLLVTSCHSESGLFGLVTAEQQRLVEVEPNNEVDKATPIVSPARVVAPVFPKEDVDLYSFEAAAGDRVYAATMTAQSATGSLDTMLALIGSDGTTVIQDDDDHGTFSSLASSIAGAVIPAAGTYYLRVNGYMENTVRPYVLYFQLRQGAPTSEVEPNDGTSAAQAMGGGWVAGARDPASSSEVDVYGVQLIAGDTVFLSLDLDPERDGGWAGRVAFGLFGDAGDQYTIADDAGGSGAPSEALFFTVDEPGMYYVRVDGSLGTSGGATATYHLNATIFPAPVPSGADTCTVYSSSGATVMQDGGVITSTIVVPGHPRIADLDVAIDATQTAIVDLDVSLASPVSTQGLFTDVAVNGSPGAIDLTLDDDAALPIAGAAFKGMRFGLEPAYRLTWFDGEDAGGTWTLSMYDDTLNGSTGTLYGWSLRICERAPAPTGTGIFATDFEADDGGFTHAGVGDEWQRGTPSSAVTIGCHSGVSCWKTDLGGTYENNANAALTSGPIAIPSGQGAVELAWAMRWQMEGASFDSFTVIMRDTGGVVPERELYRWSGATMAGANTQFGIAGTELAQTAGWGVYLADVSAFAGTTVTLAFTVISDGSNAYDGLAIDDIGIRTVAVCGDHVTAGAEACDDGNASDGDGCDGNCTATACGNGVRTSGEACDDGNLTDGDGCSATCTREGGGDDGGPVEEGEAEPVKPFVPPERGCAATAVDPSLMVLGVGLLAIARRRRAS